MILYLNRFRLEPALGQGKIEVMRSSLPIITGSRPTS